MTVVHHTTSPDLEDAPFSARAATPARADRPKLRAEAAIVADALKLLRKLPQCYARKVHGGPMGNVGEPDLDGCLRGRALKFEAKQPGKKPTPPQIGAMRRWAATGALVGWFTSDVHIEQLLDHLDDPGFVPDLAHPGCSCSKHGGGADD